MFDIGSIIFDPDPLLIVNAFREIVIEETLSTKKKFLTKID
jgi:hypothetical protein